MNNWDRILKEYIIDTLGTYRKILLPASLLFGIAYVILLILEPISIVIPLSLFGILVTIIIRHNTEYQDRIRMYLFPFVYTALLLFQLGTMLIRFPQITSSHVLQNVGSGLLLVFVLFLIDLFVSTIGRRTSKLVPKWWYYITGHFVTSSDIFMVLVFVLSTVLMFFLYIDIDYMKNLMESW